MDKKGSDKKKNKNQHTDKPQPEEESSQAKLSPKKKAELDNLVGLLMKEGVFEHFINPRDEWRHYENVQKILNAIQQLEASSQRRRRKAPTIDDRVANIDKFYKWAKENGIHYDGLAIQKFPNYDLGLVATRDIKKDELIFTIPRQLILSEENLHYDYINECFSFSNMKLVFTLMTESLKPDSFWKPYIDLLPDRYNTVLYYTVEEMAGLKGSNALSSALKLCHMITSLYVNIYSWPEIVIPMKGFKEMFSYDLLRWAVSTVMTRENLIPRSLPLDDKLAPNIAALIPFWDMANHRNGKITSFFNVETQEMESKAQDDFKKGEQVFIHYGDRSNSELMIHNGFVNALNPKDSVSIKLGLCGSDPLVDKRFEILKLLGIPKNCELSVLPPPDPISPELLAFVRIFNMNEQQLDFCIKFEHALDLLDVDFAVDSDLEQKTWHYLHVRLMLLLKAFPTTLEDDEKLFDGLKSGEIKPKKSYIHMMILEYRILEKRILAAALDYVQQRVRA